MNSTNDQFDQTRAIEINRQTVLERMGSAATDAEAEAMLRLLAARRISDLRLISDAEWVSLIGEAVASLVVPVSGISSVGIREVAKSAGIDTLTLLGTNGKTGDARVTVYQLGEVRVAETNGDSVWEEGAPAAFAELLESEGIEL